MKLDDIFRIALEEQKYMAMKSLMYFLKLYPCVLFYSYTILFTLQKDAIAIRRYFKNCT